MIVCNFITNDSRDMEVHLDGKVWPCCKYTTELGKQNTILNSDEYLVSLNKNDPDWNNSLVYPIDQILEHEFFTTYVNDTGWNSDSPPPLCKKKCSKKIFFHSRKSYPLDNN